MQAAAITRDGPTNVLTVGEVPDPACGPTDVVIEVCAAGVNRADILQIKGLYPPPAGAPAWPGLEVSGVVTQVGDEVQRWKPGDRVCALLPGGGYAECAAVDHSLVLPAPAGVDLIEVAGLVEAASTVWSALEAVNAQPGETLLVHGGTGGIGSFAVQYGVARGLRVVATAGSAERVETCVTLGASDAFDYARDSWDKALAASGGVDIVLDVMGAAYLERNLDVLATGGRLAVIGLQGGRHASLDLGTMLTKRIQLVGLTLRSRPLSERAEIIAGVERDVWPLVPGKVAPVIAATFSLAHAQHSLDVLEAGGVVGKLLLTPMRSS